ncbi:MAG: hypothetical protein ACR2PL_06095, partial [Dehalococcoidia bacterium]
ILDRPSSSSPDRRRRFGLDRLQQKFRTPDNLQRSFLSAVAAESLLGVLILLMVGVLVNQPPPQHLSAAVPGIHLTSRAQSVAVTLSITPGRLGQNHFAAMVSDHGKPPPDSTQVVLRLSYQDADRAPVSCPR